MYIKIFLALVILEILSGTMYLYILYYTTLLSNMGISLPHISCKDLSKIYIYICELCCNLAFSTFNTIWLLEFCGTSSVLVRNN